MYNYNAVLRLLFVSICIVVSLLIVVVVIPWYNHNNNDNNVKYVVNEKRRMNSEAHSYRKEQQHQQQQQQNAQQEQQQVSQRILYIVTSISEYDTGRRKTIQGYDRFTHTLVPVIVEGVQSILLKYNNQQQQQQSYKNNNYTTNYYTVDVYLITHYNITKQRYNQLREQLPVSVGLQTWDNATPYGYIIEDINDQNQHIQYHTRGLSRQHRYVIKDKIFHYDIFICFEDDMLIHQQHIHHYIAMTNTLYQLRLQSKLNTGIETTSDTSNHHNRKKIEPTFYGVMSEKQLARTIPGFIRVEVIPKELSNDLIHQQHRQKILLLQRNQQQQQQHNKQRKQQQVSISNIPMDYMWDTYSDNKIISKLSSIDPSICCHRSILQPNPISHSFSSTFFAPFQQQQQPSTFIVPNEEQPNINQIYFWEMNINALGVRYMPKIETSTTDNNNNSNNQDTISSLDWVMLLGGNNNEMFISNPEYIIGDYWSGNDQYDTIIEDGTTTTTSTLKNRNTKQQQYTGNNITRPDRTKGSLLNNQGGWMGTRRQIIEWDIRWCRGGFLPPYDLPYYRWDGLDGRTVEYWSGGIQLIGINACNLQRIVMIEPKSFSQHLLYHTSNNKQKKEQIYKYYFTTTINEFWGQINTVRKNAQRVMYQELNVF